MISCIGDLHMDYLDRHIPGISSKILSTFDKVVDNEVEQGTEAIIQLGDAFDNAYPDQEYIQAFIKSLYRHPKIPKYLIVGNHDFDDPKHYALKTIHFLFKVGFLNGQVFRKPAVKTIAGDRYLFSPHPFVVDTPPKNVRFCFGHFGYEGARGDNGYVIKSGNAPHGRWVLGDYHTAQRGKNYAYPGSLTQTKFHEHPDKYIIRLEDKVRTVKINPDYRLGRTTINTEEDLANLDKDTYWSVNISSKVKLPPNWASLYPHIIRHHAEKDTSKRQRVLMQQVASEDPMEGFADYLLEEGMTEREVARTLKLLEINHV